MTYGYYVSETVTHYRPRNGDVTHTLTHPHNLVSAVRTAVGMSPMELREAKLDRAMGKFGAFFADPYTAVLMMIDLTAHKGESAVRFEGSYGSHVQATARLYRCTKKYDSDELRCPLPLVSHANWTMARAMGFSWAQAEEFAEAQARKALRKETRYAHHIELFPEGLRAFSDTRRSGSTWDWREFADGVRRYAWETPHFDKLSFFR